MAQTITKGATTIIPNRVLGYEADTDSKTVTHQLLSGAETFSVLNDSGRSGILDLLFLTEAAAWEAHALHATAGVFTLDGDDHAELTMNYVRDGSMKIRLDPQTRVRWILSVGFREVLP